MSKTKTVKCRNLFSESNCDFEFKKCMSIDEAFTVMLIHSRDAHKELMSYWKETPEKNTEWLNNLKKANVWDKIPYDEE